MKQVLEITDAHVWVFYLAVHRVLSGERSERRGRRNAPAGLPPYGLAAHESAIDQKTSIDAGRTAGGDDRGLFEVSDEVYWQRAAPAARVNDLASDNGTKKLIADYCESHRATGRPVGAFRWTLAGELCEGGNPVRAFRRSLFG